MSHATSTSPSPTATEAARPARAARRRAGEGPSAILAVTFTLVRRLPVTASGSGTPSRGIATGDTPRRGVDWQLVAILAIGLAVRLIMAYGIDAIRGSGFKTDLDLFRYWADNL